MLEKARLTNVKTIHKFYKPPVVQYISTLLFHTKASSKSVSVQIKVYELSYAKVADKKMYSHARCITGIRIFWYSNKLYFIPLKVLISFLVPFILLIQERSKHYLGKENGYLAPHRVDLPW